MLLVVVFVEVSSLVVKLCSAAIEEDCQVCHFFHWLLNSDTNPKPVQWKTKLQFSFNIFLQLIISHLMTNIV